MHRVNPAEWRWLAICGGLVLLAFSVPYLVGLIASRPEMTFGGFVFALEDIHSYIAKMRYGASGAWGLTLVYTTEPQQQAPLVFAYLMLLGRLAGLLGGAGARSETLFFVLTYHAARLLCGGLYLTVLYRFVAEYLDGAGQRRLAWGLIAVCGGLGYVLMGTSEAFLDMPVDFYLPEAFSFLQVFALPHLALARALMLGGWLLLFGALRGRQARMVLAASACWAGMTAIVPFFGALLGVLIAAWLLAQALHACCLPWAAFRISAIASLPTVVLLLINWWVFTSQPVFRTWAAQNLLPSPAPLNYVLAYGLLIPLAAAGAWNLCRNSRDERNLLLFVWPLVAATLIYLPLVGVQRRLVEGVNVPLGILAVHGLWRLAELHWPGLLRRGISAALIALLLPAPLILLTGATMTAAAPALPVYHPADERAAFRYLRENALLYSHVLATFDSGNILPAQAPVRVYAGHGPETVNAVVKAAAAESFFGLPGSNPMSVAERRALLREAAIRYVWVGPDERDDTCTGGLCFDPAALGLAEAFSAGEYTIYEAGQ
ncbi:MAG: hypothetical protein IT326_03790 [Anaerolineae bacterium]|nr:hypothetical protein [Anaerolineae bacterium]